MSDTWARIIRTLLQLVASGALYGLTQQFATDVPPEYTPYVLGGYTLLVVIAQNVAENSLGKGILRKPGVPPQVDAVDSTRKA